MERNFAVRQSNEWVQNERSYDLHNNYDFAELTITAARHVRLRFTPNVEHGKGLRAVVLDVQNVDFLELSEGFGGRETRDLAEIGYKSFEDRDLDWLVGQDRATDQDHLVLRFSPEDYVRIHAQSIELREADE